MAKRWPAIGGVLLVAAVFGLMWWSPKPLTEPVYEGMPLSYWLGGPGTRPSPDLRSSQVAPWGYPDDRLAEFWARQLVSDSNAIPFLARAITKVPRPDRPFGLEQENLSDAPWVRITTDSNAIPFLIRAVTGDTRSVAFYRKWIWPRLPSTLKSHLAPPPHLERERAAVLLGRMGPMAKPAIPVLVKVIKEGQGWYVRRVAVWALGSIGGPDGSAIAAVTESLNDKDPMVRYNAAHALMAMDPQTAEPSTGDLFPNIRIEVAIALGELGKDAQPAVPALTALLRDTNRVIRTFATNAMRRIDPNAAAKAGVKMPSP